MMVVVGDRLSAGQEITTIVDLQNLRIEAAVLEHDLPLIKVGGEAVITSAALDGEAFSGRVVAVLPLVDSTTRAGRAFVRTRGNGAPRPGMYADAPKLRRMPIILRTTRLLVAIGTSSPSRSCT